MIELTIDNDEQSRVAIARSEIAIVIELNLGCRLYLKNKSCMDVLNSYAHVLKAVQLQ